MFQTEFMPLALAELPQLSHQMKADGARFVQVLAVRTIEAVDLIYSFMVGNKLLNYRIAGIAPDVAVSSITDDFPAAFVFENEAHDLFGVDIRNISIDFKGKFYALAKEAPMAELSAAQAQAKAKAEAARAAATPAPAVPAAPTADAALEAKLAGMDPEKAAKVRAAMAAKAAKEAQAKKEVQ